MVGYMGPRIQVEVNVSLDPDIMNSSNWGAQSNYINNMIARIKRRYPDACNFRLGLDPDQWMLRTRWNDDASPMPLDNLKLVHDRLETENEAHYRAHYELQHGERVHAAHPYQRDIWDRYA